MEYVIIGSGVAGIAAIEAIRSVDTAGEITLIGSDPHGYYSRPGLAYYLTGEIPDKVLFSKRPEDFQNLGVQPLHGTVKRILRAEQHVELEGGEYVPYDPI
jgi:NADPH-dependent 2,4-dienoyl-CoA reductase/sulfur reductase-like enzyme